MIVVFNRIAGGKIYLNTKHIVGFRGITKGCIIITNAADSEFSAIYVKESAEDVLRAVPYKED